MVVRRRSEGHVEKGQLSTMREGHTGLAGMKSGAGKAAHMNGGILPLQSTQEHAAPSAAVVRSSNQRIQR